MRLSRPDSATVEQYLASQRAQPYSYPDSGASRDDRVPAGFKLDHHRRELGRGELVFAAARRAIREWRMFPRWTAIEPHAPIAKDEVVGVIVRVLGLWWLNAARIVYVIDEARRFGFAYGTLPGHAERGEERFSIEWLADDSVVYDIRAFSRPRHWAARIGYPLTRMLQHRFARDSMAAMAAAVAE